MSCSTAWSHGCRGSARRSTSSPTSSTSVPGSCSSSRGACATGRPSSWTRRWRSARAWRRPGGSRHRGRRPACRGCTSASTASCSTRRQGRLAASRRRELPDGHACKPRAGRRCWATPPASPAASASSPASGNRVVICADGRGSAERMAARARRRGPLVRPARRRAAGRGSTPEIRRPGVHIVVAPLDRGGLISGSKLAIVAEPDVTGRRRPHRQARPRPRATEGFFDDLAPGDYVVHNVHGVARFAGMVTRSMGGAERDYLQLEYRGGDRLYLPSEQIDAITPYTGGESPTLNRMGGAEWSRQKARVRAAVREVAKELVELYRRRQTTPGHAFAPDTPWQAELEQAFPTPRPRTSSRRSTTSRPTWSGPCRWTGSSAGTSVSARPRSRCVPCSRRCRTGYQAAVLVPTTLLAQQHFQTFSDRYRALPDPRRGAVPLPHRLRGAQGRRRPGRRVRRRRDRDPPPPHARRQVQEARPARRRRGAALRCLPQGGDQAADHRRRRARP